jgi:broad specificity phosphatase PhoE
LFEVKKMPSAATTTRFGLVRHAETFWNREKRIQGQSDSALTARGKKGADNWGRQLSRYAWNCILISDAGRAVETASRINNHLQAPVECDPRLREQDWGRWTGCLITQVEKEASQELPAGQMSGWKFCPPGGEDRLRVWQRSYEALTEAAHRRRGETILIVTHEGVIKSLIYKLSGLHFLPGDSDLIKRYHLHWLVDPGTGQGIKIEKLNALKLM